VSRRDKRGIKTMNRHNGLLACLATAACMLIPAASASAATNFLTSALGAFPGASPGNKAWFAGTCHLTSPATAVGTAPAVSHDCLDFGVFGFGTSGQAPSPWFTPPAWRLSAATGAAAHPDATANFMFDVADDGLYDAPVANASSLVVDVPAGVAGNPQAVDQCTQAQFGAALAQCPPTSQVGIVRLRLRLGPVPPSNSTRTYPIYNLEPRKGFTAEFGIPDIGGVKNSLAGTSLRIFANARTDGDFGVATGALSIPTQYALIGQSLTFWGVPWAASHDIWRTKAVGCPDGSPVLDGLTPACQAPYDPAWGPIRPFFSNPTECTGASVTTTLNLDSYQDPGALAADGRAQPGVSPDLSDPNWITAGSDSPPVTDCEKVPFNPTITLDPASQGGAANQATDSPSGLDVELGIPQNDDPPFDPPPSGAPQVDVDQYIADATAYWGSEQGLATSHLRDTVVTLPEGMTLNPAAADGQAACTMAQIGVTDTDSPEPPTVRFDNDDPADGQGHDCPQTSKVGTVSVDTPLLDASDDPSGEVYLAAQGDNPFGTDFAIYIVLRSPDRGLVAKLAGKVEPDPVTGRLKTTFAANPRVPVGSFSLDFKAGPRAALATPVTCGTHTSTSSFVPYSDPGNHRVVNDSFDLTSSPAGGCPAIPAQRPLNLGFSAGSTELVAGAHSPFTVRLTRGDGNQEFDRIEVTTPEGLAAKLAGVPYCPEAAIAQAIARTATGDGAKEKASPSCPASSQVGTTTIGAGAGRTPFFVSGKVYLAGPYKGAPVSMAFIVPAVAGPFDLGVQVVRTGLQINPKTAQVTAVSDTIPKILRGVPLRIRDVRVDIDRPGFTLNPTDCSEQQVTGRVFGASGAITSVSNRFQVAECARLGFKPNLSLRLFGGTKRGDYQRLRATVTYPEGPGYANIARTAVTLPHSEFLAQEHINTVCTRVQFAADQCPAGAIYGKATAISPLLDAPLTGPVYLRSSDNLLPDLVMALKGPDSQPIEIELSGRTDSKNEGIRNTFDVVPDAPVSKFTLEMMGGKKSLIVNSTDICKGVHRADVKMSAQNGRRHNFTPRVVNPACGKAKKGKKSKGAKESGAHKRNVASRTLAEIAGGLF
jgi:hypothetical protein